MAAVNWRQDTWSDLQLFLLFNAAGRLLGYACGAMPAWLPCCFGACGSVYSRLRAGPPHSSLLTGVIDVLPARSPVGSPAVFITGAWVEASFIRNLDETVPPLPQVWPKPRAGVEGRGLSMPLLACLCMTLRPPTRLCLCTAVIVSLCNRARPVNLC